MKKYSRHSTRLRSWDYSMSWLYFVTICTYQRECIFGDIVNGKMELNENGNIVNDVWHGFDESNPYNVETDAFQIMPNHIHGILVFLGDIAHDVGFHRRGVIHHAQNDMIDITKSHRHMGLINQTPTLGHVVRYFKAKSAYQIHQINPNLPVWQRNYHDRIIRNEKELEKIRRYIELNPIKWELDQDNPLNFN